MPDDTPDDLPTVLAALLVRYHEAEQVEDRDGWGVRLTPHERSTLRAAYLMAGKAIPEHLLLGRVPAWS